MHRGYIKLWRQLFDDHLWKSEPFSRAQAWIDLQLLANHKPGVIRVRGIRIEVPRGSLAWSEIALSERWKWSRGKTRRFLKELMSKKEGKIVQQKNRITSLIQIVNYDQYQGDGTTDSTTCGQQTEQKTVPEQECSKNETKKKKDKRATRLPDNFEVTEGMREWFSEQGFKKISIEPATEEFCDYWRGCGHVKVDWVATWRNWMRNAEKWSENARSKKSNATITKTGGSGGRSPAGGGSKYNALPQTVIDLG